MGWTNKKEIEFMKDIVKEIHTDDKKLPLPDPYMKSYWTEFGGEEIAEYSPETVMDFYHALQFYVEEDEKKIIMPAAIEIMNCGISNRILEHTKETENIQEDELEVPDYIYVF